MLMSWTMRPASGTRRAVAVDGKTLRGSGAAGDPGRHLLAALDHAHGVVLGQADVEGKRTRSRCSPPCWTGSTWPGR